MYNLDEMATVGLFEAKQKLSELVERARGGEEIEITRHGKIVAKLIPAGPTTPTWKELFENPKYRIRLKRGVKLDAAAIRELINEGRE